MATIFLSYRRTDSPQACRVYEWLVQRFGNDAVFMDVAGIPFAVSFPDFISQSISDSKILVALIGAQWLTKIHEVDDPVRIEIELAIINQVPVLPVLIGTTPMPGPDELPASISTIARQNAATVGVSHDFHTHMQALLPKIESILGTLARQSVVTSDPTMIRRACLGITRYLSDEASQSEGWIAVTQWLVVGSNDLLDTSTHLTKSTLFLHRVARLAELLELHFILSFWSQNASDEQLLAGWVTRQLEQTPLIPGEFLMDQSYPRGMSAPDCDVKIRGSDQDPRQIWKMLTDAPLRLSLAYVATVSPKSVPARATSNV